MITQPVYCSFCDKSESEVGKIIAGKNGIFICNECVDVCNDILADTPPTPFHTTDDTHEPPTLFLFRCPSCGHQWRMGMHMGHIKPL